MRQFHSTGQQTATVSPALAWVLLLLLILFTLRVFSDLVSDEWAEVLRGTFGVTEGITNWRAWQNRLLGPYLVLFLSRTGLDYMFAMQLAIFSINAGALFLVWRASLRVTGNQTAALAWSALFAVVFLGLQYKRWFIWDSFDLLFFCTFAYLILRSERVSYVAIVPLFVLATLNREIGLVFALFLVLDGFDLSRVEKLRLKLVDPARSLTGAVLLVAGIAYTKLSRDMLFVATRGGGDDAKNALIGNHLQIFRNARDILKNNWFTPDITHNLPLVLSFVLLAVGFWKFDNTMRKAAVFACGLFLVIASFGVVNETRVLMPLLPLFYFIGLRWNYGPVDGAGAA